MLLFVLAGVFLAIGCSAGTGDASSSEAESENAGALAYQIDDDSLTGTFTRANSVVHFNGAEKDGQLLDVVVEVNGAVLTATLSKAEQAIELDGFVSGSGAETAMRQQDRAALLAFERALEAVPELAQAPMALMLRRSVSLWAQMSDSFPLSRSVTVDENKSYNSLCNYCGQWISGTHDCDVCGDWATNCTSAMLLGNRDPGTQYWSPTFYDPNTGSWTSAAPDHVPDLYEKGDCFGRCGDACSSVTFDQVLTEDCLNHDQCVRNGHWIGSAYCDDELALAMDDYFGIPPFVSSAPNCGYSIDSDGYFQVCATGATCTSGGKFGLICKCKSGTPQCPAGWYGPISAITLAGGATCRKTTVYCP